MESYQLCCQITAVSERRRIYCKLGVSYDKMILVKGWSLLRDSLKALFLRWEKKMQGNVLEAADGNDDFVYKAFDVL